MIKEKRILALIIVTIIIAFLLVGVVAAQEENIYDKYFKTIINKWTSGQGLSGLEAKITLALIFVIIISMILISLGLNVTLSLILSVLISFLFTAYITPDAIIGIFTSYDIVPMTIAIILPLVLFFAFSAFAGYKGSSVLMTVQLILWAIAFILYLGQVIIELTGIGGGLISTAPLSAIQKQYWWITIIIGTIVSGIMAFANGWFMNFAVKRFAGVKDLAATSNIEAIKRGMKAAKEIGKEAGGG